jgi:hypothetical protein
MFPRHQLSFITGVDMATSKQRRRDESTKILRELVKGKDVEVWQYSSVHLRLIGNSSVDYWPSTRRIWVTGSQKSGFKGTPQEALEIALFDMDGANELHAALDSEYRAVLA